MSKPINHSKAWNSFDNTKLTNLVTSRINFLDIAISMGRTVGAVISQAKRLNLIVTYTDSVNRQLNIYYLVDRTTLKYNDIKGK